MAPLRHMPTSAQFSDPGHFDIILFLFVKAVDMLPLITFQSTQESLNQHKSFYLHTQHTKQSWLP